MVHVAKVMAGTAVDLLRDEALVQAAKAEFSQRLEGQAYECPIPPEIGPALTMSAAA